MLLFGLGCDREFDLSFWVSLIWKWEGGGGDGDGCSEFFGYGVFLIFIVVYLWYFLCFYGILFLIFVLFFDLEFLLFSNFN